MDNIHLLCNNCRCLGRDCDGMADYMANCLNIEPKEIKIIFFNGDMVIKEVNASWQEIKELYPVGEYVNVADNTNDSLKLIKNITYFL